VRAEGRGDHAMVTAPLTLIEPAQSFDFGSMSVGTDHGLGRNGIRPEPPRPHSYSVWAVCALGIQSNRQCGRDFAANVLFLLAAWAMPDGRVEMSRSEVGRQLRLPTTTQRVWDATRLLEETGHLEADRRKGRPAVYHLLRDRRDEQLARRGLTGLVTMKPRDDAVQWASSAKIESTRRVSAFRQRRVLSCLAIHVDKADSTNVSVDLIGREAGLYPWDVRHALEALERYHLERVFESPGLSIVRRLTRGIGHSGR